MQSAARLYNQVKTTVASVAGGEGLKARIFRGGAWLGAGSLAEQSLRFGRNMLLARLLAPEAFGTMAIVLSTTSVLQSLTDVGVKEALIQSPRGREDGHVGAAWWMAVGRSCSLYAMLFLVAPLMARFYGNLELSALLRVASAALLFEGAISSRAYVAMKEMKFSKWAAIHHGGGIAGVVITVILSFFMRDVWALVIGYCSENAARCLLSYVVCPFLPPLRWSREAIRDLLKFSRGLFGLSILNLIFARADIFVLAKLYSTADLGLYTMAVYLVQTPAVFVINLLNQTLLPTFSHVQDDQPRTNRILLQATTLTALLGVPALVFLAFCGRSLLVTVYGPRYGAAGTALTLAACVAVLNVANSLITTVFYSKGTPELHRRSVAIMAALMVVLVYPLARGLGMAGGQLACLLAVTVGYLFQLERIRKLTSLDLSRYRKSFVMAAALSLSVAAMCLVGRLFPIAAQPVPNIIVGIAGCLLAYAMAGAVLMRRGGELSYS